MDKLVVDEVSLLPVKPKDGLLFFASVVLNNQIYIGNIAVYTSPTLEGGYRLCYPDKVLPNGKRINCVHPITREAGEQIREAVVRKIDELVENVARGNGRVG